MKGIKGFQKGHGRFRSNESYKKAGRKISKAKLGYSHLKITKEKISEATKGRTPWNKGKKGEYKLFPNGRRFTEATKRKMSIARKRLRGEKSPSWKGGYEKFAERQKRKVQKDRKDNPEKYREWDRNHRAKRRKAEGSFTKQEWENLKKKYGYVCLRCKKKEPQIKLVPDHIIPLAKKGTNYISNIQPLCEKCNGWKYTKIISYLY